TRAKVPPRLARSRLLAATLARNQRFRQTFWLAPGQRERATEIMSGTWEDIAIAAALILLGLVTCGVLWLLSRLEGYDLGNEMVERDNPAVGIRYALLLLALVISLSQVVQPQQVDLIEDLARIASYGAVTIVLLLANRYLTDFLILRGVDNRK